MKNEKTVKLLLQAGLIPETVVRQLKSWRLLPEDYDPSVDTTVEWESPGDFVSALEQAMHRDRLSFKETVLDSNNEEEEICFPEFATLKARFNPAGWMILGVLPPTTRFTRKDVAYKITDIAPEFHGDHVASYRCSFTKV